MSIKILCPNASLMLNLSDNYFDQLAWVIGIKT
jgi:hypothetical protein